MAIRFSCPTCRTVLSVGDEQANTKVMCPTCQQKLQVPTPPLPPAKKTVLGVLDPPPAPPPGVVSPPQEKVTVLSRAVTDLDEPELYSHNPRPEDRPVVSPAERLAQTALIIAVIGLLVFGFPLGVVAAVLATISLTMPNRNGNGTAIAALIIGVIAAFLHFFIMLVFFTAPRH